MATRPRALCLALLAACTVAVTLPVAAKADLVPGGWLDKPKLPPTPPPSADPPPAPVAPPPLVRRPLPRPRPAQQRAPANGPPSDGSVRF